MKSRRLLWYINFTIISLTILLNDYGSDEQVLGIFMLPMIIMSYKLNFKGVDDD
jgi:glucose-6-phosphate-specific signal transduction histidine kinase